jgi:ssDNA-binding Zn-finger/Zn-ribbon topoisomerase 1
MKDVDLTWVCPYCSHEMKMKYSELEKDPDVTCPNCGKVSGVDAKGLREGRQNYEKRIEEMRKRGTKKITVNVKF